jgi:hypothetical protein
MKDRGHDIEKEKNRKQVQQRSKMWTTVNSSDDEKEPNKKLEDEEKAKQQDHKSKQNSKNSKRLYDSSSEEENDDTNGNSSSSNSSTSSESSGSESDSEKKRKRRQHHEEKKKIKKSKTKKHKKSKKSHKKSKKKKQHHTAVNQNAYGKYGILRESDFHTKAVSFQAWLRDVKKIFDFNGPKWEAMELFREYMEDFNTATLPHEKYYDIEKYEMKKYKKKLAKQQQQVEAIGSSSKNNSKQRLVAPADEETIQRERQAAREAKEKVDFQLVLQTMDKDKIEAMRHQEQLRAEMRMHYKAGNLKEARRIEQILNSKDEFK